MVPHSHVILTGKSFYGNMVVIQGDLQGQFYSQIKVKLLTILLYNKYKYLFLTQ